MLLLKTMFDVEESAGSSESDSAQNKVKVEARKRTMKVCAAPRVEGEWLLCLTVTPARRMLLFQTPVTSGPC